MKKIVIEKIVTEDMLAVNVGSGSLRVLATPALAAIMEESALKLAKDSLNPGTTTVGTELNLCHTSPSPLGAKITVEAELLENDMGKYSFKISAYDDAGIIAKCIHKRVAVTAERFQNKADTKF